ncbi:PAS domain S-box protein [Flavobacterium pedocola]
MKKSISKITDAISGTEKNILKALFKNAVDPIMIINHNGAISDCNKAMCEMLHHTRKAILQLNISSLIKQNESIENSITLETLLSHSGNFTDLKLIGRNGNIVYTEINTQILNDQQILVIFHNISERVKKFKIINKSGENNKDIFENNDIGYTLVDTKFNIVYFNEQARQKSKLFLEKEFKVGDYYLDTLAEKRKNFVLNNFKNVLKGKTARYDIEYPVKDGSINYLKVVMVPIRDKKNNVIGICIYSIDFSSRKKMEHEKDIALYQLNERIKELTTLYLVGQIFENEKRSIPSLLKEIVDILPSGWQFPEITAARITIGKHEAKTTNYKKSPYLQQTIFSTTDYQSGTIEIVYLEEKPKEYEGPFLEEERKLLNMIGEILRVNLSRKYEMQALKKSEANLQAIFNTTETAYTLIDNDLKIISFNQQTKSFFKKELKKDIRLNKVFLDYFSTEQREDFSVLIPKVLKGDTIDFESKFKQKDTTENWYYIKLAPVLDISKKVLGFMLTVNNITERKRFDEHIRNQLLLLKELSFITSHELRHEYAKLHSIVDVLNQDDRLLGEERILVQEGINSFNKINAIIYKLNDKLTFGQSIEMDSIARKKNMVEDILLVDDDLITNLLHSKVLEKFYQKEKIHTSQSVDEAIIYLKENDKKGNHLILLDLNMPKKTGWDFLVEYRNFEKQSPVIILTSSIDPKDKKKAREFDVVKNFVSKPLRFDIIEKIKHQVYI